MRTGTVWELTICCCPLTSLKGLKQETISGRDSCVSTETKETFQTTTQTALAVPEPDVRASEPSFEVVGRAVRQRYTHPNDDFVQPGNLYRLMTEVDWDHLIGNIVNHLGNAKKEIQLRRLQIFEKADPEYDNA